MESSEISGATPLPGSPGSSSTLASILPSACLFIAAGLWFVRPMLGIWPLLLVAFGLVVSVGLFHQSLQWTVFDPPLLLFLASAALGAVIAQSQGVSWLKFWEIVSSIVVFRAVLLLPAQVRLGRDIVFSPYRWLFGLLPALIALFFLLTNDWQQWGGKMAWLDAAGSWLSRWSVALPGFMWIRSGSGNLFFHPNVAGGLIAALIPLQLAALLTSRSIRAWATLAVATLVSLAGLVLTGSRGAWLALAATVGIWVAWEVSKRWPPQLGPAARRRVWLVVVVGAMAAALFLALSLYGSTYRDTIVGRLDLYQDALNLAMDTPFTGLGLGGERFRMAYSSYVLLLHVGFLPHSHNLPLQLLLEQGILGLAAVLWIALVVVTRRGPFSLWQAAARASFAVVVLHGMVDIPLYTGRGVHLLFLPLAVMVSRAVLPKQVQSASRSAGFKKGGLWKPAVLLVALLILILPATQSSLQVNLGALAQQRAELTAYTWPAWPIQDELRRSPKIDLAPAIARYHAALVENPRNAAANRRLGQIELSLGQYDAARAHLEAAYAAAPHSRATRQMLAESYAIAGDVERAAELLRTVGTDNGQIDARVFWYEHIGEPERAAWLRQAEREGEYHNE